MENHGAMGIEGRFRVIRHDTRGLYGSGPNGAVEFEDLWELDEHDHWRSRYPSRVIEDRTVKNKFTRRGLSYMMYSSLPLSGLSAASRNAPEIHTGTNDRNPFIAFCLIGDDGAIPSLPGDAKVDWNESDGQYDVKIAHGSGSAVYGRRGINIANTTSGIFKKVQIRYPNSSPNYEEQEYTFFAQANGTPAQTGDNGLDNFVAKSLCLAASQTSTPWAIGPGFDELYSQIGIRAVLGLPPVHQGYCDRNYVHENYTYGDGSALGLGGVTALHKFIATETIDTRHGYVADPSELADTALYTRTSENMTFVAADKTIEVTTATFDTSVPANHHRKTIKITAGGSNPGPFTVKQVINSTKVEVFETVVNEGPTAYAWGLYTRNTGDKVFDSRVENEGIICSPNPKAAQDQDAAGAIIAGEKYATTASGTHIVGRIWPKLSPKVVTGIRITFPKASVRDYCPNRFIVQYLNATHSGGSDPQPADPTDWTNCLDYSGTDQAGNIFDNGEYGYEYIFATPTPATCGIRLKDIAPVEPTARVEIATLYIFTAPAAPVTVNATANQLKVSLDGGLNYKVFTCPNVTTSSVQTLCDALNRALYGWGYESLRSTFGYFWLRATCSGQYSTLDLALNATNPINSALGLPNTRVSKGVTQPFTKLSTDAATFIYTVRMGGNFPKPV